jgi:hypothetical protein
MALKITKEFKYRFHEAKTLWIPCEDSVFIESSELAVRGESVPPLLIKDCVDLFCRIQKLHDASGTWIVEMSTDKSFLQLSEKMSDFHTKGNSMGGHFGADSEVDAFWEIHNELSVEEPWNYELPWAMACFQQKPAEPTKFWDVEWLLQNWNVALAIFVQAGWFGFVGLRTTIFEEVKTPAFAPVVPNYLRNCILK